LRCSVTIRGRLGTYIRLQGSELARITALYPGNAGNQDAKRSNNLWGFLWNCASIDMQLQISVKRYFETNFSMEGILSHAVIQLLNSTMHIAIKLQRELQD